MNLQLDQETVSNVMKEVNRLDRLKENGASTYERPMFDTFYRNNNAIKYLEKVNEYLENDKGESIKAKGVGIVATGILLGVFTAAFTNKTSVALQSTGISFITLSIVSAIRDSKIRKNYNERKSMIENDLKDESKISINSFKVK